MMQRSLMSGVPIWSQLLAFLFVFHSTSCAGESSENELSNVRSALGIEQLEELDAGITLSGTAEFLGSSGTSQITLDHTGRFIDVFSSPVSYVSGFDGSDAWELDWNGSARLLEFGDRDTVLLGAWLTTGVWTLSPPGLEITGVESSRFKHTKTFSFHIGSGKTFGTITVDSRTWLPKSYKLFSAPIRYSARLDDWVEIDGIRFPGHVRLEHSNGNRSETRITSGEQNRDRHAFARRMAEIDYEFDTSVTEKLVIRRAPSNHLLTRVSINGGPEGWWIFDSGAGVTVVTRSVARRLGLKEIGSTALGGIGGHEEENVFTIAKLTVGPVTLNSLVVFSIDLGFVAKTLGYEVEGVIGYALLSRVVAEIDMHAPSVALYEPASYSLTGASWRLLHMNRRQPAVEASFEGHTGIFGIDTGAPNSFLTMHKPTVDALALLDRRDTNETSVAGIGGRLRAVGGELDWFDFGGTRFNNPSVVFAVIDRGSYGGAYAMGTVGGRVIENFKMVTDYSSRRISFKPRQ